VRPAACTSLMSGDEILRQGRRAPPAQRLVLPHGDSSMVLAPIGNVSGAVVWLAFRSVGVAAGA